MLTHVPGKLLEKKLRENERTKRGRRKGRGTDRQTHTHTQTETDRHTHREKEWKEIQPDYSKSSGAGLVSKESGVRYPQKALKPCTVPKAGLESTRSSQGE